MLLKLDTNSSFIYPFFEIYDSFLNYLLLISLIILFRSMQNLLKIASIYIDKKNFKEWKNVIIIFWWEPWSYEIPAYFPPFEKKFLNTPWFNYYYYRLESWTRWHILEDRICIFVLFFLWVLS